MLFQSEEGNEKMPPRHRDLFKHTASGSFHRAPGTRWLALTFAILAFSANFSVWNNARADRTEWASPPQIATDVAGKAELAFAGRRGVGVSKTFMFPKKRVDNPELYFADPYVPHWKHEMTNGRLDEIRRAGFDFLRIAIDPGPIFAAGSQEIEKRLADINYAVSSSLQSGLKVVVDVHVDMGHPIWNFREVTAGTERPVFRRYLEAVTALAGLVSDYDPKLVALEVFNEPPPPCKWSDRPSWPEQLDIIYDHARRGAPRHTLILSGACYASIEGLSFLDGSKFDGNTMFSFHYYNPFVFTHQGYWYGSQGMKFMEYIAPLPYPPQQPKLAATLAGVEQTIGKSRKIKPVDRPRLLNQAERRIKRYFTNFAGRESILADFAKARAWADRYAISPQRILLGEFGAMKDIYGYKGAKPADRARWLSDVRQAAETNSFAWSVWTLTNTMGIVTGDLRGPLDQDVLDALELERQ